MKFTSADVAPIGLRTANVFCRIWSKFMPNSSNNGGSFSKSLNDDLAPSPKLSKKFIF